MTTKRRSVLAVANVTAALWLVAAMAITGAPSKARAAASCIDPAPGVPADTLKALSRGVNLAGWTDGPEAPAPGGAPLRALRKAGMTHVRLPVPAEKLMRRFASEPDVKQQLLAVDKALNQLTMLGYRVSVDLHPGDEFNVLHRDNAEQSMSAMRDAWSRLAPVIKRHPPGAVLAELLNEPDIDPGRWQTEAGQLAAFVRQLLPQTTLVVGPTNWQRADSLQNFRPLDDPNVVYAIHFYDPMAFTHQGHWDPEDPLSNISGLPYPIQPDGAVVKDIRQQLVDGNKARALHELDHAIELARQGDVVATQLEPAVAWQKQFSRPLIINEFGVLKARAPPESRINWLRGVVDFAERHCWGWTHWELAQGFGLLDDRTGKPDAGVMRALLARP